MKQRWKSILKECAKILFFTFLLVTLATDDIIVEFGDSFSSFWYRYLEVELWLISFGSALAVYFLFSYFEKINPREMYYTTNIGAGCAIMVLSTIALIAIFLLASFIESLFFKIV